MFQKLQPGKTDCLVLDFAGNIAREARRIQELVDRMMELTALESRRGLETVAPVALARRACNAPRCARW
mgnify:CR=1 FL=1